MSDSQKDVLQPATIHDAQHKDSDPENLPQQMASNDTVSKSQMKKLMKKERWQEMKASRRLKDKEKKKKRRQEQREQGLEIGVSRKKMKQNAMKNSACPIKVGIDCSFDELMSDKDIKKLGSQLQYCYSANRRATDPLQLYITSVGGKIKSRLDSIGDYTSWDVYFRSENYLEVFSKDNVVYLTSESPNVLDTMDPNKSYIIGGLVDHNHHKGYCYNLAVEKGIEHAQLPIGEYIQLNSRTVLTINHVFEILLRFSESKSWEKAFFDVIPKRKGVSSKCENDLTEKNSKDEQPATDEDNSDEAKIVDSSHKEELTTLSRTCFNDDNPDGDRDKNKKLPAELDGCEPETSEGAT